jgi:NAD(P)-dependent dehydrogenase (short-subunit alcohol dehydrogenase family)
MMSDIFDISGRVAIVTGASSGIGMHMAKFLASRGARVAAVARQMDKLEAVVEEISANGGEALAIRCDVADDTSIHDCIASVNSKWGAPRILLNNAGVSVIKDALSVTREDWDRVIGTNLNGAWVMAQACARQMVEADGGSIINITSLAGSCRTLANASPYTTAKAGLTWLTKVMAIELATRNVRINAIAPGLFNTNLGGTDPETTRKRRAAMIERIPARRVGELPELEGPVLLLASDASSYITGSVMVVDGGYSENSL